MGHHLNPHLHFQTCHKYDKQQMKERRGPLLSLSLANHSVKQYEYGRTDPWLLHVKLGHVCGFDW